MFEGDEPEFVEMLRKAIDSGRGGAVFSGVLPAATVEPGETRNPVNDDGQPNQLAIPGGTQIRYDPMTGISFAETLQQLRCKRDFRNQNQNAGALREHLSGQPQIHLCLA